MNYLAENMVIYGMVNSVIAVLLCIVIAVLFLRQLNKNDTFGNTVKLMVAVITLQVIVNVCSWITDALMMRMNIRMLFSCMEILMVNICHTAYASCMIKVTKTERPSIKTISIIGAASCVIVWILLYSKRIFIYVNDKYVLMDTYWLALIYPLAVMIACTVMLFRAKTPGKKERITLSIFGWIPTLGVVIRLVFNNQLAGRIIGVALLLIMYINMIILTVRKNAETEKALEKARMETMVSQIRPHFIFNSLSSIIDLCPEHSEAQEALIQFAKYLRVNIDALSYNYPRLLSEELQHTKAYLTLEKFNYGGRLQIEYDIQAENITLPVLTLQPLVENAVKHSFVKHKTVNILIKTQETDKAHLVIVEDDGGGFDQEAVKQDGKRHTGIDNVRYRLKEMCDATLTYENIEEGTRATITIPKNEE